MELDTSLKMSTEEVKTELYNEIKRFYEKILPEWFEQKHQEKPVNKVFLINIDPQFCKENSYIQYFYENVVQLDHFYWFAFSK